MHLIFVFHLLMIGVVALLLGRMLQVSRTERSSSHGDVFVLCLWGAVSAALLAIVFGRLSDGRIAGQRFAEGLFFEGALFVAIASYHVPRQRKNATLLTKFALLFAAFWAVVGAYALFYEPWNLQVKRYEIATDRLQRQLRIVFIADIQTDQIGPYEENALLLAKSQNADLILFGGDYLQYDHRRFRSGRPDRDDLSRLLRDAELKAPLGVYAVSGNHEMYDPGWEKAFRGAGIDVSDQTRSLVLTRENDLLRLTLLSCRDSQTVDDKSGLSSEDGEDGEPAPFHLLLGHDPSCAGGKTGADLHLAGHTHGGQVCIPGFGPIITFAHGIPRSWGCGKTELADGSTLIISNGVGMERGPAPRIRFWCPPQIVVVDLLPSGVDSPEFVSSAHGS